MEDERVRRAREEAESAIKLAHQMAEILGWVVADMRVAQVLRPQTATNILQLLSADDHSMFRSKKAMERLRERFLQGQTFQERDLKRETPPISE